VTRITFNLANLPPHRILQVSFSLAMSNTYDSTVGCVAHFIQMDYSGTNTNAVFSGDYQVITIPLDHTASSDQITLSYGGDMFGQQPCMYFGLMDVSFVAVLCIPGCSLCSNMDLCITCSTDPLLGQLYFDQTKFACVSTCTKNYYVITGPPATYKCNLCDEACNQCFEIQSS